MKDRKNETPLCVPGQGKSGPPLHPVWRFFKYDPMYDRCFCQVSTGLTTICRIGIKGRKSTNLKTHLRTAHPKEFYDHIFPIDAGLSDGKSASQTASRKRPSVRRRPMQYSPVRAPLSPFFPRGDSRPPSPTEQPQQQSQLQAKLLLPQPETNNSSSSMGVSNHNNNNINQQIVVSSAKWPIFSREHIQRVEAMFAFLVEADLPASIVMKPAFKRFVQTLDPKFQLPGTSQSPPDQTASISILDSCSTSELNSHPSLARSTAQFTSYNNSEIVLRID